MKNYYAIKLFTMKTPITYYGGKQNILPHILPKIPIHTTYVEPFFGGGALFFAKEPSKAEVVNDINNRLINFYRAIKYDFDDLQNLIDDTFHSRQQHREAGDEYDKCVLSIKDPLQAAWAIWVQTNMSFSCQIKGGFGFDVKGKCANKIFNKKTAFTEEYKERLKKTTIESYDVLKVMKLYDSPETFFYLDPPYVSANQGHYAGYTEQDFINLLDACQNMKGKFILSSYPEPILMEYRQKNNWKSEDIVKTLAVTGKRKENKTKIECLTWNFE